MTTMEGKIISNLIFNLLLQNYANHVCRVIDSHYLAKKSSSNFCHHNSQSFSGEYYFKTSSFQWEPAVWLIKGKKCVVLMPLPVGVTHRPLLRVLLLLGLVCAMSPFSAATTDPHASSPEQGVTFSHVYKIDVAVGSSCKTEALASEGKTGPNHPKN